MEKGEVGGAGKEENPAGTGPQAIYRISRSFKCHQEGNGTEATECQWESPVPADGTAERHAFRMEPGPDGARAARRWPKSEWQWGMSSARKFVREGK